MAFALGAVLAIGGAGASDAKPAWAPTTSADWSAIAKLPDWSGVWVPDVTDQKNQETSNTPPWNSVVAPQMSKLVKDEKEGHPFYVLKGCVPYGMPAIMLMTHNSMEILYSPGRVTMLGESDGNRLRRIYTDGRKHPADPDITAFGHSIGHWEGDALVVDTVAVSPQSPLAISEAVAVPNDGEMHIVERIHLTKKPDELADDLTITDSKVLSKPWTTTRLWHRLRAEKYEIVEGECVQGLMEPAKDKNGHDVYVPVPEEEDGAVYVPPAKK